MAIVALVLAAIVTFAAARGTRSVWANKRDSENPLAVPPNWPYGGALWRGWIRSTLVAVWAFPLLLLWWACSELGVSSTLQDVLLAAVCASFLLFLSVVFFARPKLLIPPHLRELPSAFSEWEGKRPEPVPPPDLPPEERREWRSR